MKHFWNARLAQSGCGALASIILAVAPIDVAFAQTAANRTFSLSDVLNRAVDDNPVVAASIAEVDALLSEAALARRWDNPTLGAEIEDFGGDRNGLREADTTLSVSQTVPLGGDRQWAYRAQSARADAALIEAASAQATLLADTARAFVSAYSASRTFAVRQELLETAQRTANAINARVDAGRASPIERRRAEILVARASIARDEARLARTGAVQNLAAIWAETALEGDFISPLEELNLSAASALTADSILATNLQLRQLGALATASRFHVRREQAEAIPDVTLGTGLRRFGGSDDIAFLATIELPIPVLNRNRDGIQAALFRENGARLEAETARRAILGSFARAAARLARAQASLAQLEERVLPASHSAFAAAQEAYSEGAMSILDLLDIQRTYFDVRIDVISAQTELAAATIDIDLLAGAPMLNALASVDGGED
ncbi:TolC family protein [Maricaulis sp. CAU 1757]